jgi:ribosome-associated protein
MTVDTLIAPPTDRSLSSDAALRVVGDFPKAADAARTCEAFRGRDTLLLDLTAITPLFDYFVITTATNRRQMHAIADEVTRLMRGVGSPRLGEEGYRDGSGWIVVDYGDVVLHVFTPEARALYDLENLWGDAPRLDWANAAVAEDEHGSNGVPSVPK